MGVLLAVAWPSPLLRARQIVTPMQQPTVGPGQGPAAQPDPFGSNGDGSTSARLQDQRQHMAEDERHKRIVADTDKLLELATELKADVDKSTKNELSITVINKAAEIEKLSHDVKERMKN